MTTTPSAPAPTADPVPFDAHGIEPIAPEARDSTPSEQFWIWFGANLAPINWVLGALGIALGLSLLETIVVVAVGNVFGCALFGLFNVIGHRTAVNQMVLGRAPFGRRGGVVPGVIQCVLTMAWVGVNTWVVLDLALAVLAELGVEGGTALRYAVAASHHACPAGAGALRVLRDPHLREVHGAGNRRGDGRDDGRGAHAGRPRLDGRRGHHDRRQGHRCHPAAHRDRRGLGNLVDPVLRRLQPLRPTGRLREVSVLGLRSGHVRPHGLAGSAGRMPGQREATAGTPRPS